MGRKETIEKIAVELGESEDKVLEYFEYLDALRISGVTNMFGATPYLIDSFNLKRPSATTVLSAWMNSFGKE